MSRSKIEWTDRVWNPVRGCTRVSEGCRNCYAERQAARWAQPGQPYAGFAYPGDATVRYSTKRWTGQVALIPDKLSEPLRWRKPRRVFVNSMSDLFHEKLRASDIAAVFGVMAACPQHTFQILTKRPRLMQAWMYAGTDLHRPLPGKTDALDPMITCVTEAQSRGVEMDDLPLETRWPLPNVWLGVSVEDQATADERIPLLLQTPAAVRFVSYEPALGPVDFAKDYAENLADAGLDWIIAGGESGPGARPAHPDWFRSVRDQCKAAGVPFFFKQWGEWVARDIITAMMEHTISRVPIAGIPLRADGTGGDALPMLRVGKTKAGRLLDGVEHSEFP